MTRQQPPTACAWLHRLLIVLTLSGFGIVQAGHCAEGTTVRHSAGLTDAVAMVSTSVTGAGAAAAGPAGDHRHTRGDDESPGTSADACQISPTYTLGTTVGERRARAGACPHRVHLAAAPAPDASPAPRPHLGAHRRQSHVGPDL